MNELQIDNGDQCSSNMRLHCLDYRQAATYIATYIGLHTVTPLRWSARGLATEMCGIRPSLTFMSSLMLLNSVKRNAYHLLHSIRPAERS